jgi:uncharacterized protein
MANVTQTEPPWLVTREKIDEAVRRLVSVAHPRKVILFGSAARGELHRDSDADFLVVLDHSEHPRRESVRIRRALGAINMPVDIVVVAADRLQELADQSGLIYAEALRSGQVVYDRAA